jgi:hypothetical protein
LEVYLSEQPVRNKKCRVKNTGHLKYITSSLIDTDDLGSEIKNTVLIVNTHSHSLRKQNKYKVCKTMLFISASFYGSEAKLLTTRDENRIHIFERKDHTQYMNQGGMRMMWHKRLIFSSFKSSEII